MVVSAIIILIATLFLAYSNGANDNFKGVATLFGSGTTNYKGALIWATITTGLGSVTAIFLAGELVKNFSGKGLVPDNLLLQPAFAIAVAAGAGFTVLLATKFGFPISTTHSIVGALTGIGITASGSDFNFGKIGTVFFLPLILSPFIAILLAIILYFIFTNTRKALGLTKESKLIIGEGEDRIKAGSISVAKSGLTNVKAGITDSQAVEMVYSGRWFGISLQKVLDFMHFVSAGVVSFARGLNDTPKIVGLLLIANLFSIKLGIILVGIAIAIGGILNARKVAETISKKITPMNHGQGFTANLVTGLVVISASSFGMPVSTTHVSVGSIFGIGTVTGKANKKVISEIALSWVLTLPIAAVSGSLIYLFINNLL